MEKYLMYKYMMAQHSSVCVVCVSSFISLSLNYSAAMKTVSGACLSVFYYI